MMKRKAVVMCLETKMIEWCPAKYQLLEEFKNLGFETYLCLPGKCRNEDINSNIDYLINTKNMMKRSVQRKIFQLKPDTIVAFTVEDTDILSWLPWIMRNTSFYYFNLEIYTKYRNGGQGSLFFSRKMREILYTKGAKALIAQDPLRCRVLAKHHIAHKKTLLIPNTYCYDSSLKLGTKRNGLIYSGGIWEIFLKNNYEELCENKNVPITFAGQMDAWSEKMLKKIRRSNSNINVRRQRLAPNEYTAYLQQYAVGLVWYSTSISQDDNLKYMGLSSGKFFKHLSLGQPVIVFDCPEIGEEVEKNDLGIVISRLSEIEDAYYKIMDNYDYYQTKIIETYREKYDFGKVIKPLMDMIMSD